MNIELNRKILYRKAIREAYKNMFGRKPDLEYENLCLQRMIQEEKITLTFINDCPDWIVTRNKGDKVEYVPWDYEWQGLSGSERVKRGLYIHCYGMGEFEVLREGIEVTSKPLCKELQNETNK